MLYECTRTKLVYISQSALLQTRCDAATSQLSDEQSAAATAQKEKNALASELARIQDEAEQQQQVRKKITINSILQGVKDLNGTLFFLKTN